MAAITPSAGGSLNSTPAPVKQTLSSNYLSFTGGSNDWSQQYLPDLYEQEVEVFGNRSVASFLRMVGAEMPMTSDQVVWSEQGRLHLHYKGASVTDAGVITIANSGTHAVRVGQTIVLSDNQATPTVIKAYVSAIASDNTTLTVIPYSGGATVGAVTGFDTATDSGSNTCDFFVFGSEFKKGTAGMTNSVQPSFASLTNKPIIIKDKYEVSGSDASQIGWVEVSGEDGQSGYMWYLKAAGDTKARFADYLEMAMLEAVDNSANDTAGHQGGTITGTEGLFDALETRGNVANTMTAMADYDELIHELDANGAIEENMMFMDRTTSLQLDDILAAQNSYGSGGTSYGVFNNSEDMALNLGFTGFRRGSYDFYKSDFKYLNDASTRGLINSTDAANAIRGILIPAGVSTVYDQGLGKNIKRPFLHVRYRASQMEDRKMKTWTTGSVGAATSDLDAMEMHMLSERCLVTQGANNFVLFKGAA